MAKIIKKAGKLLQKSKNFRKIALKVGSKMIKWSEKLKHFKPLRISLQESKKYSTLAKNALKKYGGKALK